LQTEEQSPCNIKDVHGSCQVASLLATCVADVNPEDGGYQVR